MVGGISYYSIEILWRGYSHTGMLILGGLCFVLIGLIGEYYFTSKRLLIKQQVISCIVITLLELVFGLVLNIGFKLDIWDYSNSKYNFMGQICLEYSMLWFLLSLPTIIFYDFIGYWLFGKERPNYKLI